MIDPFDPIQVTLVNRIHAEISGLAIGLRLPTFAKTGDRRTGLLEVLANLSVAGTVS